MFEGKTIRPLFYSFKDLNKRSVHFSPRADLTSLPSEPQRIALICMSAHRKYLHFKITRRLSLVHVPKVRHREGQTPRTSGDVTGQLIGLLCVLELVRIKTETRPALRKEATTPKHPDGRSPRSLVPPTS